MPDAPELVLIVDPDPKQQWFLATALMPYFYVIGAAGLVDANAKLMTDHPAIILIELDEPDGDGIAWIRHLRTSPRWQSLTIACVTRRSTFRDKVASFHAGADDYMVKPVDINLFRTRIILLQQIRRLGRNLGQP